MKNIKKITTKIVLAVILLSSTFTMVSADRTPVGLPSDGVLGQILQSLGGNLSQWVDSSTVATSTFTYITTSSSTATSTFAGDVYITGNLRVSGSFFAPVAISSASDIRPSVDVTYSLGTGALRWLNTYTQNIFATTSTVTATSTVGGTLTVTGKTSLGLASTTAMTVGTLYATGTTNLASTTITGSLNVLGTYQPRVVGYASNASTTINVDTTDIATTTLTATTTFVNPTGTIVNGQMFEIWARATTTMGVYWGTNFASSTDLNNVSQIASGTTRFLFEYRQDSAKWELIGLIKTFLN